MVLDQTCAVNLNLISFTRPEISKYGKLQDKCAPQYSNSTNNVILRLRAMHAAMSMVIDSTVDIHVEYGTAWDRQLMGFTSVGKFLTCHCYRKCCV